MPTSKPQSARFAEVETKSDKPAYPPVLKHGGLRRVQDRSLRGGRSPRRSNLLTKLEIASGKKQERLRNDINYTLLD